MKQQKRSHRLRFTILASIGILGCLSLGACSFAFPTTQDVPKPIIHTNPVTKAPGVQVTFELAGKKHTVSGQPDRPMCIGAEPGGMFSSTDPQFDSGASFDYEMDGKTSVAVWAISDYAVQFSGHGVLKIQKADDGSATYSLALATGRASVVPFDKDSGLRIGDIDMRAGEQVEATAAFLLTCPATQ